MRVLGIDPGFGRCGIAIVDGTAQKSVVLFSDCVETAKELVFAERLRKVGSAIERAIETFRPDAIALEEVYFSKNQKTAFHVAEVRGMILHIAASRTIPVLEYNPGRVKVAITGYGKATKQQIMDMVPRLTNITKPISIDDEYDAVAVALTHLAEARSQKIGL